MSDRPCHGCLLSHNPECHSSDIQCLYCFAREMLVVPQCTHRSWSDKTHSWAIILFNLVWPLLHPQLTSIMQNCFSGGWGPNVYWGKALIVSSKQGVHVQASNWKATVAFNIIGWCWESYHKLNFCSPLHWWSLGRGWACNLGVQVCWGNNLETLVLLRV